MYYGSLIKVLVMIISFYFIKTMNIPDSYKFLLTVIPSLLLLGTSYAIRTIQYAGKNKPLTVKLNDTTSDKRLVDEFFFEPFSIELSKEANATLYEKEEPFWIQSGGYLDISNDNNFIKIDNIKLNTNYTLEFWLRLKHLSNNNIATFKINDNTLLDITYDDTYIYVNKTNKILIPNVKWFHLVIMRGKFDTIGDSKGFVYINGIFVSYLENVPNLRELNNTFLFKNSNQPKEYNKNYHDLSNCALSRFYDRSLTVDEIQNNYLKDAYYFGLQEENMGIHRTYVNGTGLIFYLECRTPTTPNIIQPKTSVKPVDNIYNISKDKPVKTKKHFSTNKTKESQAVILVDLDDENTNSVSEDWLSSVKEKKKQVTSTPSKKIKMTSVKENVNLQNNWLNTKLIKTKPIKPISKKVKKVNETTSKTKTGKPIFKN